MDFKQWIFFIENKEDENLLDCLIKMKTANPDCWSEFYSRFQPRLLNYLKRKTKYYEDISQIIWKKLLTRFQNIRIENCKKRKNNFVCNKEYKKIVQMLSQNIEGYLISAANNALKNFYTQNFAKEYSPWQQKNIELFRTNRPGDENWMNNIPEKGSIDVIARKKGPGPTGNQRIYRNRVVSTDSESDMKIKEILQNIKNNQINLPFKSPFSQEILIYALELKYGLRSSTGGEFQKHHGKVSMKSKDIASEIEKQFRIRVNSSSLRGVLSKFQNYLKSLI